MADNLFAKVVDFLFVTQMAGQPEVILVVRIVGGLERGVQLEKLDVGIFCFYPCI